MVLFVFAIKNVFVTLLALAPFGGIDDWRLLPGLDMLMLTGFSVWPWQNKIKNYFGLKCRKKLMTFKSLLCSSTGFQWVLPLAFQWSGAICRMVMD